MIFRMNALSSLSWQCFDNEWVVFNEGCGGTIIADPLTVASLMTLELGSCDDVSLVKQVAEDFQINDHEQLAILLQEKLESLLGMSWIESET